MPEIITQPSFSAGEVGPELYGRVDQQFYYSALRTCRNFMVRQYGGVSNRPGSKIVSEHKDQSKKARLIPFSFNEQQTYVLQVTEGATRFIKDGAEILESSTATNITGATQTDPVVITATGHPFSNGDDVYITGIAGMVELNGRTLRVANAAANTFELTDSLGNNIDGTGYAAYSSGGTATQVYEVTTPWQEADLFTDPGNNDVPAINFAQDNDKITIVHPSYEPRDMTRTDHDAWTITEFQNSGGPFLDINTTTTTVYASAATGSGITITASASIFTNQMATDNELFYIEQEPTDTIPRWEAGRPVLPQEVRRAGSHYYLADYTQATVNITAATATDPLVINTTTTGIHEGDFVYITGVSGMTQINDQYYVVNKVTATQLTLGNIDTNGDIDASGFSAYTSGGTVQLCKKTGTYRPDHTEGSATDGGGGAAADQGVTWEYLHSGFGIVQITGYSSGTSVTATVISRLPDSVVGSGNTTDNWAKAAWSSDQGYPSACAYHKERFCLGGTTEQPNTIWLSGVNLRSAFDKSFPILDDEAITLPLNTTGSNAIRHLLPFSELIALTSASEHLINGADNALKASGGNFNSLQGNTGASPVPPIIVQDTAVFVQDMGGVVRSLKYTLDSDKYGGIDLSARSPHLLEGRIIVDWAYQRHPFSIIWIILDNGALLGFTFMPEQQVYGWHRHDSGNAVFESVACVREGTETATYFAVKRTINGNTRRYVERLSSRDFTTIRDAYFVDCGLTYDGRNTGATTMTITGGSTWDSPEELTITASANTFLATDVDTAQIVFWVGDIAYRLNITAYTSATEVTAVPTKEIPAAYRSAAFTNWELAKTIFRPLDHLEGETVSILSDGNVVSGKTVTNGAVTLDDPGSVVHIGLGYTCDLETLDLSIPNQNTRGKTFNVPRVFITMQESRTCRVSSEGLATDDSNTDLRGNDIFLIRQREVSDGYDAAIPAATKMFEHNIDSTWNKKGRIALRQTDPLPVTINGIHPEVAIGTD